MNLEIEKLSHNKALKMLAVILLSEGYVYNKGKTSPYIHLGTLESSTEQHELFEKLCLKLFNKKPRKHIYCRANQFTNSCSLAESRLTVTNYIQEFYKLSPTYKTTPYLSGKKAYLSSNQPSIKFLFNESVYIKKLALSIWFDFDGCISPVFKLKSKFDKKKGKLYHYFQIQFECEVHIAETNPNLVKELIYFCHSLGLNARIKYHKKYWSGIEGIVISDLKSIRKFVKIGPVTDIMISNKGKKLNGFTKRNVCKAVNELLSDDSIPISCYFKSRTEAEAQRLRLNALFRDKLMNHSPVV